MRNSQKVIWHMHIRNRYEVRTMPHNCVLLVMGMVLRLLMMGSVRVVMVMAMNIM